MVTTHGGSGRRQPRTDPNTSETVSAIEHYTCSLAGLAVTGLLCGLLYAELVVLTQVFVPFAGVLLVAGVFSVWALCWLAFEFVWEWASTYGPRWK